MSATGLHRLTAKEVQHAKEPGKKLADGGGLYLYVTSAENRKWVFRYTTPAGARREMGLGFAGKGGLTLEQARNAAKAARDCANEGGDPIETRRAERVPKLVIPTFGKFADNLVEEIKSEFKNDKHIAQWRMTLGDTYCRAIRSKRIDEITSEDVLRVLQPIWLTKNETASRLRGRIERVLDAAKARGFRIGENPAVWRGGLKASLPKRQKLSRGHHAALSYEAVPGFIEALQTRGVLAAGALEFLILTGSRSGEVRLATWREFDLDEMVWTIPAERMKAGRPHRVPLTPRMIEILENQKPLANDPGDLVFPGQRDGRPMSDMTFGALIRRMGFKSEDGRFASAHGFRSAFRDWVGEATQFQREVAEAALAHTVGDATERAYRRGDALEKRRKLMRAWEDFCLIRNSTGKVVRLVPA